jgi:hypothetical protein
MRKLCEFTTKRGDLDRRFTPPASTVEGAHGQNPLAQRRGVDYETEIPLEAVTSDRCAYAGLQTATTHGAAAWKRSRRSEVRPTTSLRAVGCFTGLN